MATADPQSPDQVTQQEPTYDESVSSMGPSNVDLTSVTVSSNAQSAPTEKGGEKKIDQPLDAGLPNTTARANMPGFMFETKYIMLNFMSLIPPDLYAGQSSPDSLASDISTSDNLTKSNPLFASRSHSLSKSQSLDTGLQRSHPKLKHIHKLKHFQQSVESPASDDNLNYKYRLNSEKLVSPDGVKSYTGESSHEHLDLSNGVTSHTVDSSHDNHSSSSSPRKRSLYRMASDISSSGDFSYISDADDEFEDYSNASSIFSSRGLTCRDGFLDLRNTPRLSTLMSESESLDEPDTCNSPLITRHDLQDVPEETEVSDSTGVNPELTSESSLEVHETRAVLYAASHGADGGSWCSRRQAADRSKLTLDIPCPPVQLGDILLSLQTDLNSEMSELETEYEEAVRSARDNMRHPCATPLTPQTQAARILARMGDEVKAQYGHQISSAVNRYLLQRSGQMSYKLFKEIAQEVVDVALPGWRQVALLLVFGQRVLWSSVQHGNKQVEDIIEYCSQLVADVAAEFIIKQGGWGSVMNSDPSLSSESFSTDADSPPCVVEYFASHDVTQIESKEEVTAGDGETNTEAIGDGASDTSDRSDELAISLNIGSTLTSLDSIQVPDAHKDRLKSFGFDVRDWIDSDAKQDSFEMSLDYINSEETEGQEDGTDGKISGNNSDIFLDDTEETTSMKENDISETDVTHTGENSEVLVNIDLDQSAGVNDQERPEPKTEHYAKDSVYVKQKTPTPLKSNKNNDSENDKTKDAQSIKTSSEPIVAPHGESQVYIFDEAGNNHNIPQAGQLYTQEVVDNQRDDISLGIPDEHADSTAEGSSVDTPGENTPKPKSDTSELDGQNSSESDSGRDLLGHFRSTGVKVMVATLAVLVAGVSIKIATVNR